MAQLEPHKDEILSMGSLVFIAAQKRGSILSNPEKFLAKDPTSFPFLLDEDRKVTKSYGVYTALNYESINIAHPGTLVVDPGGKIRYIFVGSNQTDRAPIDNVLAALKGAAPARLHQT